MKFNHKLIDSTNYNGDEVANTLDSDDIRRTTSSFTDNGGLTSLDTREVLDMK